MGRKIRSATLDRIDEEQRTRDTRQPGERIDDIARPGARLTGPRRRSTRFAACPITWAASRAAARRIVYFSEGIDYDINDVFNNRGATTIMMATQDAIAAATRANVADLRRRRRAASAAGADELHRGAGRSHRRDLNLGIDSARSRTSCALGQDSLRVLLERDRRLRARQHQRLRQRRSSGSSPTTAPTTCSATTRPTSGATAASARSRSRFRASPEAHRPRPQGLRRRARPGAETESPTGRRRRRRAAQRDAQPAAAVGAADGADRRGVQGRRQPKGAVVLSTLIAGGDAAAHREGRHLPQQPRAGVRRRRPERASRSRADATRST